MIVVSRGIVCLGLVSGFFVGMYDIHIDLLALNSDVDDVERFKMLVENQKKRVQGDKLVDPGGQLNIRRWEGRRQFGTGLRSVRGVSVGLEFKESISEGKAEMNVDGWKKRSVLELDIDI
ncbi:hypothetical protein BDQ12DRAFT_667551 [Crucibulum laeve]|uniref:Uncharacterized protein n=1 Tax=Crucibulum laeve TaxID=68775 RepID=A0A5C3LTZ4_9AGAR|nr:hypothetical protein BDQ12DRAFT_667551 [Crucibulum laeve]